MFIFAFVFTWFCCFGLDHHKLPMSNTTVLVCFVLFSKRSWKQTFFSCLFFKKETTQTLHMYLYSKKNTGAFVPTNTYISWGVPQRTYR